MIVAVECLVTSGLESRTSCLRGSGLFWRGLLSSISFVMLLAFLLLLLFLLAHDPRYHSILLVSFVPTSSAFFLFQSPYVQQCFTVYAECVEDGLHSFYAAFRRGQVVEHSNADGEIEMVVLMRQLQDVGNDSSVRLVRRGELDKRGRAVTANNEDIRIDGQIFAVSTANVESYRSRSQLFEELLNDRPWLGKKAVRRESDEVLQTVESHLVASGREVRCNLLVYIVHVLSFILCSSLFCCHVFNY
jgi:hypothetical protein